MKRKFLPLFILVNGVLYSAYYNVNTNSNINVNGNVNHNVSGSVFEYKTINTIDYGALQLANAQREKNKIEQEKFADEKQRLIAIEISENPIKAYDYGTWFTLSSKDKNWNKTKESKEFLKKQKEISGFSEFRIDYVVPTATFTLLNAFQMQNVSPEGVTTDFIIYIPSYNQGKQKVDIEGEFEKSIIGKEIEMPDEQNKMKKIFFHKKELNRTTLYGAKGYRETYVWEDKFESGITDNYRLYSETLGNGFQVYVKVRYYGNKTEVDFEKVEGRRYYLKPLIDKIISTAKINDLKIAK